MGSWLMRAEALADIDARSPSSAAGGCAAQDKFEG